MIATFSELKNIHNADDIYHLLSKSVIVVGMFSIIWGIGITTYLYYEYIEYLKRLKEKEKEKNKNKNKMNVDIEPDIENGLSSATISSNNNNNNNNNKENKKSSELQNYIKLLIPNVYSSTIPLKSRIMNEMKQHHKYLGIFFDDKTFKQEKDYLFLN